MYEGQFAKGTNYKEAFKLATENLFSKKFPIPWRIKAVDDLCEAYVTQTGEIPDSTQLTLLADYILTEDLTNRCPDKVTNTEYPILSGGQVKLRNRRELPRPNFNSFSFHKDYPKKPTQRCRGWANKCQDI